MKIRRPGWHGKQIGIFDKLARYMYLSAGWHFGEGVPISRQVARKAKRLAVYGIFKRLNADVFPVEDGGLVIEFYASHFFEESLSVAVRPSLSLDLTMERGIGPDYTVVYEETDVSASEARRRIRNLTAPDAT